MNISELPRPCTQTDGMEDPQIIPDDNISTPPGSTGSPRPGDDDPLTIPPEEPNKEVTVDLTSDDYPEAPELGDLTPTHTDNVDTFQILIKPEGSTTFVPLDLDEDGVPDVCNLLFSIIQIITVHFQNEFITVWNFLGVYPW